jgi:cell division protein ZapD
MRLLLRLEYLFGQLGHQLAGDTPWANRQAISCIIDVLNLLDRADLKTELIKEIDRLSAALSKLRERPHVDDQRLVETLNDLKLLHQKIQAIPGRLGDSLRQEELIGAVKQRLAIPGGSCSFDLPALHFWLSQPEHVRKAELLRWAAEFKPIEEAAKLLLELIRSSAYQEDALAERGFFQKAFESTAPCQLIQIKLNGVEVFPEVSGGKHRVSVRFLTTDQTNKPTQAEQDVNFAIACCII